MRIARNKFIGKSNSIRNTSSSWNHLGSCNNKCQHGKLTVKPKEENMHNKLKKLTRQGRLIKRSSGKSSYQ